MGWRAALLQRGEQAMVKEMDIRDARSDTCVVFIEFDHRGHYLPFCASARYPC